MSFGGSRTSGSAGSLASAFPERRTLVSAAGAVLVTLAGTALAFLFLGLDGLTGIDDANITLTYAGNLAEGHGLVYTPGYERVEGFTSLLWVLVAGMGEVLPGPVEAHLLLVSVLLCAGTLLVAQRTLALILEARGDNPGAVRFAGWALVLALLLYPAFFAWNTVTLMDLPAWSFGVVAMVYLLVRESLGGKKRQGRMALVILWLCLARPESLLVVPGMILVGWVTDPRPGRWSAAVVRGAVFLMAALGLLAFRLAYFGYPLPNTYYAKVPRDLWYRMGQGLAYVGDYLFRHPSMIVLWLLGVALVLRWVLGKEGREPWLRGASIPVLATGLVLLSVVLGGGDHFASHRFLQPVVPLVLLAGIAGLSPFWEKAQPRMTAFFRNRPVGRTAALGTFALVLTALWFDFGVRSSLALEFMLAEEGRARARVLVRSLSEGSPSGAVPQQDSLPGTSPDQALLPSVGVVTAGGFGLSYPGRTTDLMGLNWVAMAHAGGDRKGIRNHAAFSPRVFWSNPPDVVVPDLKRVGPGGSACPRTFEPYLGNLVSTPTFRQAFAVGQIRHSPDTVVVAYFARDWLRRSRAPVEVVPWEACVALESTSPAGSQAGSQPGSRLEFQFASQPPPQGD